MRTNRQSYTSTPAGSAKALDQKPKPKRSKREINQWMLMIFFILLPVFGLLAIFFQPMRWLFMIAVIVSIGAMWFVRAFLFPGRMILTAVYGLLTVFTLITALNAGHSSSINQTSRTILPTVAPAATESPSFASYSTMGTSVPEGYYDSLTTSDDYAGDLGQTSLSVGNDDSSFIDDSVQDSSLATPYVSAVKSDAEIALENFMEKWRKGISADMLTYTADSWQKSTGDSSQATRQLFWKFGQKPLLDWRQMDAPTGTDESTARTIKIQADISYSGETRTYEYDALILYENNQWKVDPDSLSTGILVEQATPTPDPNMTPTPSPAPTPTPTPSPKTKLYYNKKGGGKYYHADSECSSVNKKWFPLSSFLYQDVNKSPYSSLKPCPDCNAPERPSK